MKPKVIFISAFCILTSAFGQTGNLPGLPIFGNPPQAQTAQSYTGFLDPRSNVLAAAGSLYIQNTNGLLTLWANTNSTAPGWGIVLPTLITNGAAIINASELGGMLPSFYATTGSVATLNADGLEYDISTPLGLPINWTGGEMNNSRTNFVTGFNLLDPSNTNVVFSPQNIGGPFQGAPGFNITGSKFWTNCGNGNFIMADALFSYMLTNVGGVYYITNVGASVIYTNLYSPNLFGLYTNGSSAQGFVIYNQPLQFGLRQNLYDQTNNTVAVTNSASVVNLLVPSSNAAKTAIIGLTNLFANQVYIGAKWNIRVEGTYATATGNASTLTVATDLGNVMISSNTIAAASMQTNQAGLHFEVDETVSVVAMFGTNAVAVVNGGVKFQTAISGVPVLGFSSLDNSGATFSFMATNNVAIPIALTAQWSSITAGDTLNVEQAGIQKIY